MSADAAHGHDDHIHMPPPSIWPFFAALSLTPLPIGLVLLGHGGNKALGWGLFAWGALGGIVNGIGWVSQVIREKFDVDLMVAAKDLAMSWKLFLLSEAAIFGSFFGHYFFMRWHQESWPPRGWPEFHLSIPVLGTVMLVISSFTCEMAHHALTAGRRGLCKNWMIVTMLLGIAFLGLQGYEWGYLQSYDLFQMTNNVFATHFYMITGFHGFHVFTGLMMLIMVYARLEQGSYDRKRHFSMLAASWYWHFVDVIWVFVLVSIYLI